MCNKGYLLVPKSLDCVEKLPTVFPPSLSRGTTWTVSPREAASLAGLNKNRVRLCNRILHLRLCSISARLEPLETFRKYRDRNQSGLIRRCWSCYFQCILMSEQRQSLIWVHVDQSYCGVHVYIEDIKCCLMTAVWQWCNWSNQLLSWKNASEIIECWLMKMSWQELVPLQFMLIIRAAFVVGDVCSKVAKSPNKTWYVKFKQWQRKNSDTLLQ